MNSHGDPKRKRSDTARRQASGASPRIGPEAQTKIGNQLRAMYDDVVKQGVPDRFADLLDKLDAPRDKAKD